MNVNINKLKDYELTLVFKDAETPKTCQDDRILAYYFIEKKEYEGKKRLAYPIPSKENGVYYEFGHFVFYHLVERDNGVEPMYLTRLLDQEPNILRYLLVTIKQERTK